MMKHACLLLTCLVALPALADRVAVDRTLSFANGDYVSVTVVRGEVDVIGWDREEIRVRGLLDERARELVFDVTDDSAVIEVRMPRSYGGGRGSALEIHVPQSVDLRFAGVSTDVEARGTRGRIEVSLVSGDLAVSGGSELVELTTVSGEIMLREVDGRQEVYSVSGDIDARDVAGAGRYQTVSGDITIIGGGGDLELESVSGDIEVDNTSLNQVSGHSISGDVELIGELATGGQLKFDSVSGSVRLTLAGEHHASFAVETASGSIVNRLSADQPGDRNGRNRDLQFVLGNGASEVVLTTRSGDVTLRPR